MIGINRQKPCRSCSLYQVDILSEWIKAANRIVLTKRNKIQSSFLLNRIPADPAAEGGGVVAVAVVVEVGFGVVILRREAVGEDVGHVAVLVDRVAEGVVGVFGDEFAVLVPVADHVAVVVVAREVEVAVDADGDEPADAAGPLQRAGEVRPPEVRDILPIRDHFGRDI